MEKLRSCQKISSMERSQFTLKIRSLKESICMLIVEEKRFGLKLKCVYAKKFHGDLPIQWSVCVCTSSLARSLHFQTILIQIETYAQKVISDSIIFSSVEENAKLHSFKKHLESQLQMKFFFTKFSRIRWKHVYNTKRRRWWWWWSVCSWNEKRTATVQKNHTSHKRTHAIEALLHKFFEMWSVLSISWL